MLPEGNMSKKRRRELRAQFLTALTLAALFVLTAVPTLILVNLQARLFNAQTYQQALDAAGFYDQLHTLLARQLHHAATYNLCRDNPLACRIPNALPQTRACLDMTLGSANTEAIARNARRPTPTQVKAAQACFEKVGLPPSIAAPPPPAPALFAIFSPEQIEHLLIRLTPPSELRTITDRFLQDALDYTSGTRTTLIIPLDWLKRGLVERGPDAILQSMGSQPACNDEQITRLALDLTLPAQTPRDLFVCSPPEEISLLLRPLIIQGINTQAALLPDFAVVDELPTLGRLSLSQFITLTRTALRFLWILPLIFLAALSGVIVRGWKSWLVWWGGPLAIAGALALGVSALGLPLLSAYAQSLLDQSLPPVTLPELHTLIAQILVEIIGGLLAPISIQAAGLSATGIIMLLVARFLRK